MCRELEHEQVLITFFDHQLCWHNPNLYKNEPKVQTAESLQCLAM